MENILISASDLWKLHQSAVNMGAFGTDSPLYRAVCDIIYEGDDNNNVTNSSTGIVTDSDRQIAMLIVAWMDSVTPQIIEGLPSAIQIDCGYGIFGVSIFSTYGNESNGQLVWKQTRRLLSQDLQVVATLMKGGFSEKIVWTLDKEDVATFKERFVERKREFDDNKQ